VKRHLCNDLEAVTLKQYPEIADAKATLMANGARGALMSGSGSSVFGIFADAETARRAGAAISRQRDWQLYSADILV
jgi:4-diphosphocytidyl-2-C-methyl-D-erythritol kinase